MLNNQDFYNPERIDIEIVRGDTLSYNFQLQGTGGTEPSRITFMIKEDYEDSDADALVNLELADGITLQGYDSETDTLTYCVHMRPDKTENLDLARYYYDLQMVIDGDVFTLMKGRFTLDYDVTREADNE